MLPIYPVFPSQALAITASFVQTILFKKFAPLLKVDPQKLSAVEKGELVKWESVLSGAVNGVYVSFPLTLPFHSIKKIVKQILWFRFALHQKWHLEEEKPEGPFL